MTDSSLVSVIIPVWNGAAFMPDAVSSILAQRYSPLEILVVDDGSTDDTASVAARLQGNIRYLAFPHRGLMPTRLAGVAAARGEIIAWLDVDDLWSENKLGVQLALLREYPEILIVNGYTQLLRLVGMNEGRMQFEAWGEPVLAPSFGSALFRRDALVQLGGLDGSNSRSDLDWFMRARERQVPMLIHSDVVQFYRRHSKNTSNDHDVEKRELLRMLSDSLARRGAHGEAPLPLTPLNRQRK